MDVPHLYPINVNCKKITTVRKDGHTTIEYKFDKNYGDSILIDDTETAPYENCQDGTVEGIYRRLPLAQQK